MWNTRCGQADGTITESARTRRLPTLGLRWPREFAVQKIISYLYQAIGVVCLFLGIILLANGETAMGAVFAALGAVLLVMSFGIVRRAARGSRK